MKQCLLLLLLSLWLLPLFSLAQDKFCTVCPDGTEVPAPDNIAFVDDETGQDVTCLQLAQAAATVPDLGNPNDCADIHVLAEKCACPVPELDSPCRVCTDGRTVSSDILVNEETGETCADVDTTVSYLQSDATLCKVVQLTAGFDCGCESQKGLCGTCPDGTPFPEPDIVLDVEQNVTCGDVSFFNVLFGNPQDDCSDFFFNVAPLCECDPLTPEQGACALCGTDELEVPSTPLGETETCGSYDERLDFVEQDSDACRSGQFLFGIPCGCPFQPLCTVCPDGSPVPFPDQIFDEESETTCGDIEFVAAIDDESETCADYHIAAFECDCDPFDEPGCPLCSDGSNLTKPEALFDPQDPDSETCQYVQDVVDFVSPTSDICDQVKFNGVLACGCPPFSLPGGCTLCADGTSKPTNPDLVIDEETGLTCGDLDFLAGVTTEDECSGFYFAGALCGCPPVTNGCTLCAEGADYTGVPVEPPEEGDEPIDCDGLAAALPALPADDDTCPQFQALSFLQCGCPTLPPLQPDAKCFLCPDASPPTKPDVLLPSGFTCEQYNIILSNVLGEEDFCPEDELGAVLCGCPGSEIPITCSLCEDGSPLPDPNREVIGGTTCAVLEIIAQEDTSDEECASFRATAGVYCGCNNPVASEGACRLCGGTTPLSDAGIVVEVTPGEFISCGELEFTANLPGNICTEYQTDFAPTCCGPTAPPVPTEGPAPTDVPVPLPTEVPIAPTDMPVVPTNVPNTPTDVPAVPTETPAVSPTDAPLPTNEPTEAPVPTEPPLPTCSAEVNSGRCEALLNTTNEVCDCYTFCDGEFVGCNAVGDSLAVVGMSCTNDAGNIATSKLVAGCTRYNENGTSGAAYLGALSAVVLGVIFQVVVGLF